ncbi:hypothetical protein SAMN05518849_13213 [Sphingobium sp. AP50]|uniref:hypothetical protein n=1 Tax=Sphingobium sp. AP50 TaxID=1884369 RepID=UPI0008AFC159|nr:hypothetical protein [Sphingobium sp. AP50]SEK04016.1 hypothetical protein SAMN05518849_13213 [Sphingobium sp. AP50]
MAKLTDYLLPILMLILLLGAGVQPVAAQMAGPARSGVQGGNQTVQCANARRFFIRVAEKHAVVTFGPRQITLPQQDFKLGRYFSSRDAALIVDQEFVAFVPRGDEGWKECRIVEGATHPSG